VALVEQNTMSKTFKISPVFALLSFVIVVVGIVLLVRIIRSVPQTMEAVQTIQSPVIESPLPTPQPTPTNEPISPEAEVALNFIAEREGIPLE
jgi:hypothetical protein